MLRFASTLRGGDAHPARRHGDDRWQGLRSLYRFIWRYTARHQIWLCLLTLAIVPLSMVPLELQRRVLDDAIGRNDMRALLTLGTAYLVVILAQGGLKYLLNLRRGRVVEEVARKLRDLVHAGGRVGAHEKGRHLERGAIVTMVTAESEDVAGFVAESLSVPLLQGGTILAVLAYLVWVQPLIAVLAVLIYAPELVVVPWQQRTINRLGRLHTRVLRRIGDVIVGEGARGEPRQARFSQLADRALDTRIIIYRIKYFLTFFGNLLDALGPLSVLLVGGMLVLQGSATVGSLLVFIGGIQRVGDPLDQLVGFYRSLQNAHVKYALLMGVVEATMPPRRP